MADFTEIIKSYCGEDGNVPAEAITKLTKAITTAVGNEFVDKKRYKDKLDEIETLKADKQTAEDSAVTAEKWKTKYDTLKSEFDTYKADIASKETKSAKEKAVRAYYESKNIIGKSLDIAMRGSAEEISAIEIENGKIKDVTALDALIQGDFSGLVSKTETKGADTAKPPTGNGGISLTKSDIYKRDEKGRYVMDATERQAAIAKMISDQQEK